jgi:hypothetical protein
MVLSIPKYIEEAGVIGAPLTYKWEDDNHRNYWAPGVPALEYKIGKCAGRAVVTLSAGIAEWVAWRLSEFLEDNTLFDCIEAVYASVIDWRYFNPPSQPIKWGKGPVRGPADVTRYLLVKAVDEASGDEDVAERAVALAKLVEHVLPDSVKSFRKWRNEAIARLRKIEPLDLDEPDGNPVPREVLDPNFEFKPEESAKLLAKFLKSLDYRKNAYLSSPEKMLKAGFKGTPYQL